MYMGDYSVNSFSFNKGKIEYKGNKKTTFDLTKFDGVSRDELIQKAGGANTKQGKLLTSIFNKYDNGDGILTAEEFANMRADLVEVAHDGNLGERELDRFNQNNLGVDKNAYTMEELQAVVGMMVKDGDGVTLDPEGNVLVEAPQDGGGTLTSKFAVGDNNVLTILSDTLVNGDTTTVTEYVDGDKNKKSSVKETRGNSVTTTTYAQNGTDIASKIRVTGTVTEVLDPANGDRVTKKTTDKGSGIKEIIEYAYTEDGVTETYRDAEGGKPTKIVIKDAQGNITETIEYTYDGDRRTALSTVGSGDGAVRTRTIRNNGKLESWVNVDTEGNVQDATHTVKPGDTWYGIVQAKYGVTDHRTTMEIVHKLKETAGVSRSANTMPAEITLPAEVTLASGTKVALKNTDALVNMTHNVANAPRITPPQALAQADLPQPIEALTAEQQQITIPTYEVKPENAGKTVAVEGGQYYKYDDAGRVICIYDNESAMNAKNNSVRINYDAQGNVTEYQQNSYDEQGHYTGAIQYNGTGAFKDRWVNDQFDPDHPEQYGRQTKYNADGSINYIFDNFQYDDQGRYLSYDNFNSDGSWVCSRKLDYGNDGTCQTRFYRASDHGRLTKIESFE